MAAERRHLYGHNDAHYSGAPEKEQLFLIEEFDISPRPPLADHRLFSFLKGEIHGVSESELEQAVLNITTKSSKGGTWEGSKKFAEFPQIVVRQEQQYSKNLKPGMNEVIGDIVLPSIWLPTATYSFNMEAKLADGRTLFCFEFEYYLEGDL
ncbi:hypothetical protein PRZ48_012218 [Zasmidium cellare]|uniref:Uncharacterized protein n=1 Tax=Zasmidium cellare TaxID=395010 RepID=A0ABR0E4P2_ZASCE|nr:hypothetical protein PRZ48_012218 [Zasmidium cellare]